MRSILRECFGYGVDRSPPLGFSPLGAAYGGRCISIQSHDILDEPRVELMPPRRSIGTKSG